MQYSTINLDYSINSGQVFLWKKYDNYWYGINGQDVLRIDSDANIESFAKNKTDFFRKSDDLSNIIRSISVDKIIKSAIRDYGGLRILRQDPFQCFISFIVSANSNINNIKNNLGNLCSKFGKKIKFHGIEFAAFPEPKKIATASINEMVSCGVGYRAKFVKEAAKTVDKKQIDFEYLKKCSYEEAKMDLLQVPGIGNKVADCIMLFSLEKLNAFPLDTWMIKVLRKYYLKKFQIETKSITDKQYAILHEKIQNYFGPYCGFAQQFLFKMERESNGKMWL